MVSDVPDNGKIIAKHGGGWYGQLLSKYVSPAIRAIMPSMRGFGSKNRNLRGFPANYGVPKSFLDRVGPVCGIISDNFMLNFIRSCSENKEQ
jgi:hypothetical protein